MNAETIVKVEGLTKKYDTKAVDESLEFFGLEERRNSFAKTFSGGMKRRLNIACALGHKPEDSKAMLQDVIDNLRGSMDEIRAILRRERPDKKKTSVLALQKLCDECESEYGIKAALTMNESDKTVPKKIREIILDNTFEAVTNALKYSKCKTK